MSPTRGSTASRVRLPIDLSDRDGYDALVIRTDYSDDATWQLVAATLGQPWDVGDESSTHVVDDPVWAGADVEEVLTALPEESPEAVFVADATTMRDEHTLLAVSTTIPDDEDYEAEQGVTRQFRLLPAAVAEMHTNLALANMVSQIFRSQPPAILKGSTAGSSEPSPRHCPRRRAVMLASQRRAGRASSAAFGAGPISFSSM